MPPAGAWRSTSEDQGQMESGGCGSDIHIVYEGITPTAFQPIILGHEFSGEIAEVGEGVEGWKVGLSVWRRPVSSHAAGDVSIASPGISRYVP